ncbi:MAG: DUF3352 domain-containing protein [Candidatus Acidiferrales bacterium]
MSWKGAANLEQLRSTNPLLRFLGSPEMKANWQAFEELYARQGKHPASAGEQKPGTKRSRQEIPWRELAPLLSNTGLLAVVLPVEAEETSSPPEPAGLLVYDRTGKEEALAALEAKYRDPEATSRRYEFDGVAITETVGAGGKPTEYAARLGRWVVYGDNKQVTEGWLQALRAAPARSLKDVEVYQRARGLADSNAQLEAFLNISLLARQLERVPPQANSPSPAHLVEALGGNDFEAGVVSVSLEAARARYQVIFTPSASASGLPSILSPAVREFPSLAFAPSGTVVYSVAEVNLTGAWARLQQGLAAIAPPGQARLIQGFVAMAESLLGMKMEELLAAWGNELATISYSGSDGKLHSLRAFALRDRERVLVALANLQPVFGENVRIEELPGPAAGDDVTYLEFSARAPAGAADAQPFLYAALSHQWALLADDRSALEQALHPMEAGQGLRGNPVFQQARSRFPAELTGFSFADAEQLLASQNFAQWLDKLAQEMAHRAQQETETRRATGDAPPPAAAEQPPVKQAQEITPPPLEFKIPQGYLKWLMSASSRDARGLFFTGIIE